MDSLILHYLTVYKPLGYLLISIGLLIEGEFILFTAAFLTHQGVFDVGDMLIIIFGSVLTGDILWYFVGIRLNRTRYWWIQWLDWLVKPFDRHLLTNPFRTIFISKFTYGLHRAILIRAGMLGITRTEFLKADMVSAFLWVGIIGGLGYGASTSFLFLKHYLRFAEAALLLGLIGFFVLLHLTSRLLKKEL